jgi:lambda family phage portal protein
MVISIPRRRRRTILGRAWRVLGTALNSVIVGGTWTVKTILAAANDAYAATDNRKTLEFFRPTNRTATQAITENLSSLTAKCRQIERATPLGRAVVDALAAEIVGSGITVLPRTGDEALDAKLQAAFEDWADHALVDGGSLWSWQQLVAREIATAGAGLARILILPERVDRGWLPVAVLPLEPEWLCGDPVSEVAAGNVFVRGVELDRLGRPVAYHLRHPEAYSGGERVDATQVIHVFERRRAQQVHGEPLLAPAIERVLQDARLIETELQAAVATSAPAVTIESENTNRLAEADDSSSDDRVVEIAAGSVTRLLPGEKVSAIVNPRPSPQITAWRDNVRSDVAACTRTSIFWLDRDPRRANYSSMRQDQLMSRRMLAGLKDSIGVGTAGAPYESVLPYLCLRIGVAWRPEYARYLLRPDQPQYVDPVKDVAAASNAVALNLSTYEEECASRGRDWKQVIAQRQIENQMLTAAGLPIPQPQKPAAMPTTENQDEVTPGPQPVEDIA